MTSHPSAVANILLWFPLSSETFIYRESLELMEQGLSMRHYTMYGKSLKGCSREMQEFDGPITRFGTPAVFRILSAFARAFFARPRQVGNLLRRGLFRKMRNLEAQAENTWCFLAGFLLAEHCRADNIALIHAPWANGPATAAWVASQLTNIPFAFSGRAGDIYPEDGLLAEKAADASFIRTNNAANIQWLQAFCPPGQKSKVRLVYNGLTFAKQIPPQKAIENPAHRILAVGRFARTKGFPELLTAIARLKREGFPISLTLVGDGSWRKRLLKMIQRLGLQDAVHLPGFIPNDQLANIMVNHDLLVMPSVIHSNGDRDGIPNVIMEASSLKLPVVATDVCGIGEVIEDGVTGRLVKQRDTRKLADAIREQLENPQKAREMAEAAHDRVLKMFDNRGNAQKLADLYRSAMPHEETSV